MMSLRKIILAIGAGVLATIVSASEPIPDGASAPQKPDPTMEGQKYIQAAQKKLGATFTHFKFEEIRASELPGVVEIYAGPRIIYYAPEQDILILGEFYATNGTSITEQKAGRYAVHKAGDIDRGSALELGDGDTELIAFVDPDCGYCRLAHEWLNRQDLKAFKQYIFFMPMSGRPQAQARATQALCASPEQRAEALDRVFSASAGESTGPAVPDCKEARERLAAHAQIATKIGVYATPFFIVKGQVVAGFDRERLNALLTPQKSEGDRS